MNPELITNKEEVESLLLQKLDSDTSISSSAEFCKLMNINISIIWPVIQSLYNNELILFDAFTTKRWILTDEGKDVLDKGSPEFIIFNSVSSTGSLEEDLSSIPNFAIGKKKCMANKWLNFDKKTKLFTRKLDEVKDEVKAELNDVLSSDPDNSKDIVAKNCKKRGWIKVQSDTDYSLSKGPAFTLIRKKQLTDISADMLRTTEWKGCSLKQYNFKNALGKPVCAGALHPLMKVRTQFRQILLELGFEEMPTDRYVESSFWNFDALFQPQQHPARDAHDTFFIKRPAKTLILPSDGTVEKVKNMHEQGDALSIGHRYNWKLEEAEKNLLRTHTTAISSRMLWKLSQECQKADHFIPKKYFSIDRVFRNETLDASHLAEFHHVEGFIADRNLTLADLKGVIAAFFERYGLTDLVFKPAYNPYTEPSMEIFAKFKGKMMEIGNSGMFRPEMLGPLGLPPDVRAIAWGLSLERPTMVKYGIGEIRKLFGPKCDLKESQESPICMFD